jgi:hypothetical protein
MCLILDQDRSEATLWSKFAKCCEAILPATYGALKSSPTQGYIDLHLDLVLPPYHETIHADYGVLHQGQNIQYSRPIV